MIRVAISSDIRGFEISATLIASVMRRASVPVHIRCWCRGFLPESFEQANLNVEFFPAIQEVSGKYPGSSGPSAYDRLLVIRDCPDWDRCLIMDYDQVTYCDLAPLFELDLGDHLLAAHMQGEGVDMEYAMRVWLKRPFPKGWEHVAKHPYFLMPPLLNLAELRKSGTWQKFQDAHAAFGMDEQLSLTAATEGRILPLIPKWNLFPGLHISGDQVPDGVVHWCGWPKPWHEGAKVWRPELWESERCSWEHLRMGLWDKPVAVEVEPDDDYGVEELLKRGWKVRLLTGRSSATKEELPSFRYPDLEVKEAEWKGFQRILEQEIASEGSGCGKLERVRFGPWVRASEWLAGCDVLPNYVILRGPVALEEVKRVVAMGYGELCGIRHGDWPAGGPMPRVLEYLPLIEIELRELDATEEWYLRRSGNPWEGGAQESVAEAAGEIDESPMACESPRKVAVAVAMLGNERRHLRIFLEGLRRNFLPGVEKRVFLFTEGEPVPDEDVTWIHINATESGRVHLERFRWLLDAEKEFAGYDFLFLLKPQVRVMGGVGADVVLCGEMVACLHSAYETELPSKIRFEENKASVAWVAPGEGTRYFCGSWQGGGREYFLAAVRLIAEWIAQDEVRGIEPCWGDESYWNRYWIDLPPDQVLGADYAWRVGSKAPQGRNPKVLVLAEREAEAKKPGRPVRRVASR